MLSKSLSVIIPNYNGVKLLKEYLPYTIKALKSVWKWEIIVVDDASTDDSVSFLRNNYPDIIIVQNPENKGFSFTCNNGIKASRFNFIFFLNSDIKLTPEYFTNQWTVFDDEMVFGVMGKILEMNSGKTEVAAKYANRVGQKYKISSQFYFQDSSQFAPTAFLSGANALVDAAKLKLIGGFDEIYSPFYFEDLDLSVRAWRMGWKCYYDEQSVCYHLGSCTIKKENMKSAIKQIYFRNRFIFHGIHLTKTQLRFFYVQTIILEVLPKLIMGQFWVYKSFTAFLSLHKEVQTSRKRLKMQMELSQSKIKLFDLINIMDKQMIGRVVHWIQ